MNVPLIVLAIAVVLIAVEWIRPARKWPVIAGWWVRALAVNAVQVGIVFLAGRLWDPWLRAHRPWSLESLPTPVAVLIGYLAITFVYYWWHRARHDVDFLWRWFHQFHHSPERIEVITSFYKHPLEITVNGLLSSVILYLGCGVGTDAAVWAVLITGLAELFYHWNVATPYWLGFVFQRPESHCIHHEKDLHYYNFADLPLWDMVFGTFRNPRKREFACGFGENRELQVWPMLRGRNILEGP